MSWKKCLGMVGALGLIVSINGCAEVEALLKPCKVTNQDLARMGVLDYEWSLVSIDGKPIPTEGYPIPGKNIRLFQAKLYFTTSSADLDATCTSLTQSSGVVEAEYATGPSSNSRQYNTYFGRFARDHEADVTVLGASGHSLPVAVDLTPGRATLVGQFEVKIFGVGVTYRLGFERNTTR